jgi:hypothetical protein
MANPYRIEALAKAYSTMWDAAFNADSGLYDRVGNERSGGSHTCAFWDGFHGRRSPHNMRGTISSACYRAGKDFARFL